MKRLLILALIMSFGTGVYAQSAGDIYTGGALQFSTSSQKQKTDDSETDLSSSFSYTVLPNAGYFLKENIAIGVGIGITGSSNTNPTVDPERTSKSTRFVFSPHARYYLSLSDNLSAIAQGSLTAQFGNSKVEQGNTTSTTSKDRTYGISVNPGLAYQVSDRFAFEIFTGGLSYRSDIGIDPDDSDNRNISNQFSFGPNLNNLTVSIRYFL